MIVANGLEIVPELESTPFVATNHVAENTGATDKEKNKISSVEVRKKFWRRKKIKSLASTLMEFLQFTSTFHLRNRQNWSF
jgi:hypothetical protein